MGPLKKYKRIIGGAIERNDAGVIAIKQQLAEIVAIKQQLAGNDAGIVAIEQQLARIEAEILLANEISAVNSESFSEYRDAFVGRDVVLVAAGPSMKYYEPIKDAIHIGVNSVYLRDDLTLDFYFTQDFHDKSRNFASNLDRLKCPIFLGTLAIVPNGTMEPSESLRLRLNAKRYYVSDSLSSEIFFDIRHHPLMDFYSVAFPALHFALFTNPAKVYLVGCDTTSFGHFDGEPKRDTTAELLHYQTHTLLGYRKVKEFAAQWYPDTEIISINPVNLYGLFSDVFTNPECEQIKQDAEHRILVESSFDDEVIKDFTRKSLHVQE